MTWRAALRLPDEAAHQLEDLAAGWGVAPGVAARILVMERLQEIATGRQIQRPHGPDLASSAEGE